MLVCNCWRAIYVHKRARVFEWLTKNKSLIKNNKENFMQKQLKQNLKHETQTILTLDVGHVNDFVKRANTREKS
jgi:hypothetical protein